MNNSNEIYLSVVSPLRNEIENVENLHKRLEKVCKGLNKPFELIYVENGSTDGTWEKLKELKGAKLISLRIPRDSKKTAQTAALDAGIKAARGELIATIDADLQNPPEEIPRMIKMLYEENLDVVSGWRKKRKDTFFIRNLSKFGAWLRKRMIDPGVHDLGCTLKVYKRECFEGVDLYGEMHRYIVAILRWRGFVIGETVVEHAPRQFGQTKYNWKKMFRGFVDMWLIWFHKKYSDRPLHFFGVSGVLLSIFGIIGLVVLGVMRLFHLISLSQSIFPMLFVLVIIVGLQLFIFGMVLDLLMQSFNKVSNGTGYLIKEEAEV